jgi:hypothetical protein
MEGAVHARLQNDQLADANRVAEIQVIDRSRNDVAAAVPVRGNGSGDIDQVHDAAAENVAEHVGILGKNELDHFRARVTYAPALCFTGRFAARPAARLAARVTAGVTARFTRFFWSPSFRHVRLLSVNGMDMTEHELTRRTGDFRAVPWVERV